ncbi:hypothetical protein DSM112329_04699 [Paraconexibacter sp. AEG42_29]|uniref:Uncharacterized protein n=1 Tax=Paraconexibacter sp. AEG42_29 TaxID=2997339 RepID=A0AAU7B1H9_9ACTN
MIPAPLTPDELLTLDLDGTPLPFHDLVADGLERDYSARVPALRGLIGAGTGRRQAFAAALLAAWGDRDGLLAISGWAQDPAAVPWAADPAVEDRFGQGDATFGMLAWALSVEGDRPVTEPVAQLRVGATRALLLLADRVRFDGDLALLLDLDPVLAARVGPELTWAVAEAAAAARGDRPQLRVQAESLDDFAARRAESPLPAVTVDAPRLLGWATRLARLLPAGPDDALAALDLTGTAERPGRVAIAPPPAGVESAALVLREDALDHVLLRFARHAAPTRAALDAALGTAIALPVLPGGAGTPVAYRVAPPAATHACTVIATFNGSAPEDPASRPDTVALRRDRLPASAPAPAPAPGTGGPTPARGNPIPGGYAVADRPVRVVAAPDGTVRVSALDLLSGALVPADALVPVIAGGGRGVQPLGDSAFDVLVAALRRVASHDRQVAAIAWHPTGDPVLPHRAEHAGRSYLLEDGDYPMQARYVVHCGGDEVDRLDAWPRTWTRAHGDGSATATATATAGDDGP